MASKVVLITGANSGIGYATAKVLADAAEKFHVIMAGRSLDKIQAAKSEIESTGIQGTLEAVQLDITNDTSIDNAVQHVESTHGHLDVLISNAAIAPRDLDLRTRLTKGLDTNVIGTVVTAEKFRPLLLKAKAPYSIYVSSGAGSLTSAARRKHMDREETYRMTKAALNMFAVVEARDFGPQGLKVFTMCPGFVVSNIRGTSEEARNPGGQAGDPMVSGDTILKIMRGERDSETGILIHKDGVYPW